MTHSLCMPGHNQVFFFSFFFFLSTDTVTQALKANTACALFSPCGDFNQVPVTTQHFF